MEDIESMRSELEKYRKRYGKFGDIRNLFIGKPTLNDWITLILLVGIIIMAYFYNRDTSICRETMSHIADTACKICKQLVQNQTLTVP